MIIDETDDVLHYWEASERQLLIKARPGNGRTDKAKNIINQMIKEGNSILLLAKERRVWAFGLNKSPKTYVVPCEHISNHPDPEIEVDMLVIHNLDDINSDFPIEKIKYKHILALSDDTARVPKFFKGEIIRLINWNNVSKMIIIDKKMYKAFSDDEDETVLLSEWSTDHETQVSIKFPLDALKELLLE